MDQDRFRQVMRIVDRVFEASPATQGATLQTTLQELCGDDAELREMVERVVRADGAMDREFLESPPPSREIREAVIERILEKRGESVDPESPPSESG